MADVHTKEVRSFNMSRIRSKNTKPEMLVRQYLFSKKYRYRLHDKKLPGKPDIVLPKYSTVIFVHGCFWHGHADCRYYKLPQTKTEWWLNKITGNQNRHIGYIAALENAGWEVITVWECELKTASREQTLNKITSLLAPC